jgi:hypothetical protein
MSVALALTTYWRPRVVGLLKTGCVAAGAGADGGGAAAAGVAHLCECVFADLGV